MAKSESNTKLVIVESPAKTKSIAQYLGKDYKVVSSKGHVIDLPKSTLGVDVEHNFKPLYEPLRGKKKVITALNKEKQDASIIYLATDLDREGEAIAWHIASAFDFLNSKGHVKSTYKDKVQRVVFSEITKDAINQAFADPRGFDFNLVDAYQARRVLDRLVGYKLSPLLWKKIQYGLSAGRVQSVALRMIVEREEERERFQSETYYKVSVTLRDDGKEFEAQLTEIDRAPIQDKNTIQLFAGEYTYSKTSIQSQEQIDGITEDIQQTDQFRVVDVQSKQITKNPSAPFTTAAMQRTAATRLGFSPKKSMSLAQRLYEEGFITYHRTDSPQIAESFKEKIRQHVVEAYGKKYLGDSKKKKTAPAENAQEAHEAIRPTEIDNQQKISQKVAKKLDDDARDLYDLIAARAIASEMSPAVYTNTTLELTPSKELNTNYTFTAHGSILEFDGFIKVWSRSSDDTDLPSLKPDDLVTKIHDESSEHSTNPPPRYSQASLIKEMEAHGIGRPSTYAPTIDTLEGRNYVSIESRYLFPSDFGRAVTHLLRDHFPEIVDLQFTASLEKQLDDIALGKEKWQSVIREFYEPFETKLQVKDSNLERKDYKVIRELDEQCPECKHPLVLKLGRYGKFYSCSNFPDCKYAKPFVEKIDMSCPDCDDGEIIIRQTKRGKRFYGCTNYPDCQWASWNDPRHATKAKDKSPSGKSPQNDPE